MEQTIKPTIICLLGIHTAGKTTIGERLGQLGLPYHHEIGNELIQKVDFNSPEVVAWFDGEIMKRELERDFLFITQEMEAVVVETWHVGNIAYAQIRTPTVANKYRSLLKDQLSKYNPLFFLLDIDEGTFRQRANVEVPLGVEEDVFVFYDNIGKNILSILEEFEIDYYTIDANQSVDDVVESINRILEQNNLTLRQVETLSS